MLTGFFKTPQERIENCILNAILIIQVGLVMLYAAGLTQLSLLETFIPLAVLLSVVVLLFVFIKVRLLYLRIRDTIDLLKFQRANRMAERKQNG